MLVLSRQRDETIMIGDEIEITVVDVRGDKVRLGINAPTRIAVHRKEVYEAIKAENQRAAQVAAGDVTSARPPVRPPALAGGAVEASGAGVPRVRGSVRVSGLLGAPRVSAAVQGAAPGPGQPPAPNATGTVLGPAQRGSAAG